MQRSANRQARSILAACAIAACGTTSLGQDFSITVSSVTGGAESMTGVGVRLVGSAGQPITGSAAGGPFSTSSGIWTTYTTDPRCNPADLASPFGMLNIDDIDAFVNAFLAGDTVADLNGNGSINIDDIDAFVGAFIAGCP